MTYSPSCRRIAREMAELVTPTCRATSANESPSVVTSSMARVARGAGIEPRRLPAESSSGGMGSSHCRLVVEGAMVSGVLDGFDKLATVASCLEQVFESAIAILERKANFIPPLGIRP